MKQFICIVALIIAAVVSGAEAMRWDAANKFGTWGRPVRMSLAQKNGILIIKSDKNDPCFQIDKLSLKPGDYNLFVMEYRVPEKSLSVFPDR